MEHPCYGDSDCDNFTKTASSEKSSLHEIFATSDEARAAVVRETYSSNDGGTELAASQITKLRHYEVKPSSKKKRMWIGSTVWLSAIIMFLGVPSIRFAVASVVEKAAAGVTARSDLSYSSSDPREYPLLLKGLYVSHGMLNPEFKSNVDEYELKLGEGYTDLTVIPEVPELPHYADHQAWPLIEVHWDGKSAVGMTSSSGAVQNKFPIPGNGKSFEAKIIVMDPLDLRHKKSYSIKVTQNVPRQDPQVSIRTMSIIDDRDNKVVVENDKLYDTFNAFIHPEASAVQISVGCNDGNSLKVNGTYVSNGDRVTVTREKWHHRQIVEIHCYAQEGIVSGRVHSRYYTLSMYSDYPTTEILPPRLVVDGAGRECYLDTRHNKFLCPSPDSRKGLTRLISYGCSEVRYTVESRNMIETLEDETSVNPEIQARLINGFPSLAFDYIGKNLSVIGLAGRQRNEWHLEFVGSGFAMFMGGWFLSLALSTLLPVLLVVLTLSNAFGLGAPFGAAEIAANTAFLLQYLCFASTFLRHHGMLQGVVQVIKWVTLFWPLPWRIDVRSLSYSDVATNLGGNPKTVLGDCLDLNNAVGCIFWSSIILLTVSIARALLAFKLTVWDRNPTTGQRYTFPHRLLFGHWESRAMHFLVFPASTAAVLILTAPKALSENTFTSVWAEISAIAALLVCLSWIISAYAVVRNAVKQDKVMWVWNQAIRETGEVEEEEGYWSDVVCDQLNTHSVNRGCLPSSILPWKWTSTVADIEPIVIYGESPQTLLPDDALNPTVLMARGDVPLGGASTTVEVHRTRSPGMVCPGQKLVAGLKRFDWVDVLFTYQGLTHFHSQVSSDTHAPYSFPMTAKISQLQGPFTGGRYFFFFDGVRVPFIKIEDSIFRIVVAICMGICLSLQIRTTVAEIGFVGTMATTSNSHLFLALCYGVICLGSLGTLVYVNATRPYTRRIENGLLSMVLAVLGMSAMSFMGYAFAKQSPSLFADVCLGITTVACGVLAVYCVLIIASLIAAMTCPPLTESRFLERLSNCNVTIADHAEGWAVDLPAFSKRQTRTVKAVCQNLLPANRMFTHIKSPKLLVSLIPSDEESTFEFTTVDIKRAVASGTLRCPLVCMFAPSSSYLGYKAENVYPKDDHSQVISDFILGEPITAQSEKELVRHLVLIVDKHRKAKRKHLLSMTIIPPTDDTTVVETVDGNAKTLGRRHPRASKSSSSSLSSSSGSY